MTDYFGEIRSIVMGQPSLLGWYQMLDHLQNVDPTEQRDVIVPYLSQHMDGRWPDEFRPIPERYIKEDRPKPWLALARSLSIGQFPATDYERILKDPDLAKITYLKIAKDIVQTEIAERLNLSELLEWLSLPALQNLEGLVFDASHSPNAKTWTDLLEHPSLFGLKELKANGHDLPDHLMPTHFFSHPMMNTLEVVEIEKKFTNANIELLCKNEIVPKIQSINLKDVRPETFKTFLNLPEVSHLRYLSIYNTSIGDEGIQHLVNSPYMHNLEYLNVGGCNLTDESFFMIGQAQNLSKLQCLWMWSANYSTQGLEALLNNPDLKSLNQLNFNNNNLGLEDLQVIAASSIGPQLKRLFLNGTTTTLKSIRTLFQYDNMYSLEDLEMSGRFSLGAIKLISKMKSTKRLKRLKFNVTNKCTEAILLQIKAGLPALEYVQIGNTTLMNQHVYRLWPKSKKEETETYECKRIQHFNRLCSDYNDDFESRLEDAYNLIES